MEIGRGKRRSKEVRGMEEKEKQKRTKKSKKERERDRERERRRTPRRVRRSKDFFPRVRPIVLKGSVLKVR
jgi:hypothetical protein